MNICMIIKRYG